VRCGRLGHAPGGTRRTRPYRPSVRQAQVSIGVPDGILRRSRSHL
jgi:hypothetical protein